MNEWIKKTVKERISIQKQERRQARINAILTTLLCGASLALLALIVRRIIIFFGG